MHNDAKSKLSQLCQKGNLPMPKYNTHTIGGFGYPSRGYSSTFTVDKKTFESLAVHGKAKAAEQDAAQVALEAYNNDQNGLPILDVSDIVDLLFT